MLGSEERSCPACLGWVGATIEAWVVCWCPVRRVEVLAC